MSLEAWEEVRGGRGRSEPEEEKEVRGRKGKKVGESSQDLQCGYKDIMYDNIMLSHLVFVVECVWSLQIYENTNTHRNIQIQISKPNSLKYVLVYYPDHL